MRFLLLLGLLLTVPGAWASHHHSREHWNSWKPYFSAAAETKSWKDTYTDALLDIQDDYVRPGTVPITAWNVPPSSQCFRTYSHFYRDSETVFRIAFGYSDGYELPQSLSTKVTDLFEKDGLVQVLTEDCPPNISACGFNRVDQGPFKTILEKQLHFPGKKDRTVRIILTSSSISPDDLYNRAHLNEQNIQSHISAENLLDGLSDGKTRLVAYQGHNRMGGGPDFYPPQLFDDIIHVNYGSYEGEGARGMNLVRKGLKTSKGPPELVILNTCKSATHYSPVFDALAPKTGRVQISAEGAYDPGADVLYASLNAVLGLWCESSFSDEISSNRKDSNFELVDFFRNDN